MGVSGHKLADLLGVSEPAVRKAVKSGRITKLPDGTYDPEDCKARWSRSTDPTRTRVQAARTGSQERSQAVIRTEADAIAAVSLIRRVLGEEGADAEGTIDFGMARTAETILKAHERDLKMAQRRKELVPLAAVRGHIEKAFIGYRQTVQRLPSRFAAQIAAEVGCETAALDMALSKAIATVLDELSSPVVRA